MLNGRRNSQRKVFLLKSKRGFYRMTLKSANKYIIDVNDYEVINEISRGSFGVVFLVKNKATNVNYAAKVNLIPEQTAIKSSKQIVSREVKILIQIQHPTIIQFRGFSFKDFSGINNLTIFMEYMERGSLESLLSSERKKNNIPEYNNTKRQIILAGISRAMMLLHESHVIHRDLKPANVLLDANFTPRITDFGLSKFFDPLNSRKQSQANVGTAIYMAPEVIDGDNYNTKADVYSFGILMYEVLTGTDAFSELIYQKGMNEFKIKMKILEGARPIFTVPVKSSLQELIEKCWETNFNDRPTFSEIYRKLSLSTTEFDNQKEETEKSGNSLVDLKYCLDDVNLDEFMEYIEEIDESVQICSNNESQNNTIIQELQSKYNYLASKYDDLEKHYKEELKNITEKHEKEIEQLKIDLQEAKNEAKSASEMYTLLEAKYANSFGLNQSDPCNLANSDFPTDDDTKIQVINEYQKKPAYSDSENPPSHLKNLSSSSSGGEDFLRKQFNNEQLTDYLKNSPSDKKYLILNARRDDDSYSEYDDENPRTNSMIKRAVSSKPQKNQKKKSSLDNIGEPIKSKSKNTPASSSSSYEELSKTPPKKKHNSKYSSENDDGRKSKSRGKTPKSGAKHKRKPSNHHKLRVVSLSSSDNSDDYSIKKKGTNDAKKKRISPINSQSSDELPPRINKQTNKKQQQSSDDDFERVHGKKGHKKKEYFDSDYSN